MQKPSLNRLVNLTAFAALSLSLPVLAQKPEGLKTWEHNYPVASRELGQWVRSYPDAASIFFEWDSTHPVRSRDFVAWVIGHPKQPIENYLAQHPKMEYFADIQLNHHAAADGFMAWCRRRPEAAKALMVHTGGLDWAGRHIYQDAWHPKHPQHPEHPQHPRH